MSSVDLDTIHYPSSYLTQVVARIDLVSPVESIIKTLPPEVSKIALAKFPIDEPKNAFERKLNIPGKGAITDETTEFVEWNFHGRNRDKRLVITPKAVYVSYSKYESYEVLCDDFCEVFQALFKACPEAQPSRLGLRYINQIRPKKVSFKWGDYVEDSLLGLFDYAIDGAQPSRIFHNLGFAFSDFNLTFQFGIHNPDYPASIRQNVFVLDFDTSHQGLLEPGDIPSMLDTFHKQIQLLFERSIAQTARDELNAE